MLEPGLVLNTFLSRPDGCILPCPTIVVFLHATVLSPHTQAHPRAEDEEEDERDAEAECKAYSPIRYIGVEHVG